MQTITRDLQTMPALANSPRASGQRAVFNLHKRHIVLCLVTIALIASAACSRIEEPWISSDDQFHQERTRTDDQQKQLRHRLITSQIDR